MATRFEMLDKQLDRLERLFARKKRVTEFDDNSEVARKRPATPIPFSPRFDATSMSFPQPSYIRPTSSRMMAREEISMAPQYIRRARSLPEASNTPSLGAPAPENESTTAVGDVLSEFPAVPSRQPSIAASIAMRSSSSSPQARSGRPSPELMEFTFSPSSAGPDSDSSATGRRSRTGTRTPIRTPSVSPKAQSGRTRYFTGAQESPISPASLQQKLMRSPKSSLRKLLAPPLSARPTLSIRTKLGDDGKNINRSRSLSISGANARDASEALRKSISLSNLFALAPSNPDTASFKEPSLNDFLALSDDDIADGENTSRVQPAKLNPPTFGLPSSPSPTASPVRSKPAHPLLTLSPPLASRPAAAAAFEAARIATKYQFDLVYVVNLWPSHMSRPSHSSPLSRSCGTPVATSFSTAPTPSPPESPVSQVSEYDSSHDSRAPTPRDVPRSGITGRLLAAYGLTSLMNPFRISAPAHQKMLRTSDWLKYNNYTGIKDEFACGYGRSFYTGHSAARGSDAQHTTTAQHKNQPANRGIVFAAFRVPREDGEPISLNPQELEELHQDAQALVDMLIDMHMTPRRSPTPISATPSRSHTPIPTPSRCRTPIPAASIRCAAMGVNTGMMGPSTPLVTA